MAEKEVKLMKGNEVIAHAAIRYGCDGYFGYPITPQSEVMETLMELKPWETTGMVVLLGIIVIASFLSGKADVSRAVYANWTYAVPLLSSAIFCYIAQYAVPELARGMRHTPKKLPVAIILGMFITGVLLAVAVSYTHLTLPTN